MLANPIERSPIKFFHAASACRSPACAALRIFFELSLSRADVEQRAARERRLDREGVADQSRTRSLRLEASDLSAGANETVGRSNLVVADLARAPAVAEEQLAVSDDAAADSRAEREQHEVFRLPAHAERVLAQRRAARVVGDEDRHGELLTQGLAQRRVLPAEVRAVQDGTATKRRCCRANRCRCRRRCRRRCSARPTCASIAAITASKRRSSRSSSCCRWIVPSSVMTAAVT